jgi:hypothetical protein
VIPLELTESIELSDIVAAKKIEVADMILKRLDELGISVTRK